VIEGQGQGLPSGRSAVENEGVDGIRQCRRTGIVS
jgi:hypothetical protein